VGGQKQVALLYYLNKVLHSVDWYFEIMLPDIFSAEHSIGSVMGRAVYSDKFFFYQGCTVGGNNSKYPVIGENVTMYSNSSILGNSKIGNNVILGAGCMVKDAVIPGNCLVFGQSPDLVIKEKTADYILAHSARFWKLT
jgi:serine O-acetyltransferase